MLAAVRYRPVQAALLAALSAIVVGCAAFTPLYERALEQSLVRGGLSRLGAAAGAVELSAAGRQGVVSAADLRAAFPAELTAHVDPGRETSSSRVEIAGVLGSGTATVWAIGGRCAGLTLDTGRCPQQPFEVLASTTEAGLQRWSLGTQLRAHEKVAGSAPVAFPTPLTVVGTYTQQPGSPDWLGIALAGRAGGTEPGLEGRPLMDALVTVPETFTQQLPSAAGGWTGWSFVSLAVTYQVDRERLDVDDIAVVGPALERLRSGAPVGGARSGTQVSVRTGLGELVADVTEGQRQARVVVPLLMAQLALLAVVVLGLVAGSAVEQRRPEIALARLRGHGARGAGRLVLAELALAVAAGAPVGVLGAWAAVALARRSWLVPGVPAELPALTLPAAVAGLAAALVALVLTIRPTTREPVTALLRRVPPRRSRAALGVTDSLVVGVSAVTVYALASGNLTGPLALATPALLALAVGLVLAHLIVPVASRLAGRYAARGRLTASLAALQVARRPAVRRIVTLVTVTTALSVFAADALVVAQRNRELRSRVEVGAPAVLTTDAVDPVAAMAAVHAADPSGRRATPVVWARQANPDAVVTLAVDPQEFAAVADLAVDRTAFDLAALAVPQPTPPRIVGRRLSATVTQAALKLIPIFAGGSAPEPPQETAVPLVVRLVRATGSAVTVTLGSLPLTVAPQSPVTLTAPVDCTDGCAVVGLGVDRQLGDTSALEGSVTLDRLGGDEGAPADVGRPGVWLPRGTRDVGQFALATPAGTATAVRLDLRSLTSGVEVASSVYAAPLPVLVAGGVPAGTEPGGAFQGAGLDGLAVAFVATGEAPYAPGRGGSVAIASLPHLLTRATVLGLTSSLQVLVADPALVEPVTAALRQRGIAVTAERLQRDQLERYDNSASAWGLRLALLVAVLAVVLAALVLVLVAVTAWRGRVRDYAALRMSGVPAASLHRASVVEQAVVVAVATVVGTACGIVAGAIALPILPLFTVPSATYRADLTPALAAIALAAVGCLAVLVLVAVAVGARLVGLAGLGRIREGQ